MASKLCVRNPNFKNSFLCSGSRKNTNLCMREDTLFRKASQLAKLCHIDVCIIYFRQNGELKIWPEEPKVREMAKEYMKLSQKERMKKSTNIFVVSKNKLLHQFSEKKVTEMEDSLESHLQKILEPEFPGVETEPEQNQVVSSDLFATNLSYGQSSFTRDFGTEQDLSPSQDESKYSVFLDNHENGSFYQIPNSNSVSSPFDPTPLLMAQQFGIGSNNNNNNDLPWDNVSTAEQFGLNIDDLLPPEMQTQLDQFFPWYQTSSFPDPDLMFSHY